jgi:hypothetical protein
VANVDDEQPGAGLAINCNQNTMEKTRDPSISERASLLCYLAVHELAALLRGGGLSPIALAETARIWIAHNSIAIDRLERFAAARTAKAIAVRVVKRYSMGAGSVDTRRLFVDSLTTNYADRIVGYVWAACWNEVAGMSQTGD